MNMLTSSRSLKSSGKPMIKIVEIGSGKQGTIKPDLVDIVAFEVDALEVDVDAVDGSKVLNALVLPIVILFMFKNSRATGPLD